MLQFESHGVRISYQDLGSGHPVVLVHGFASNAQHNWGATGWIELLATRYRVLAADVRGHGDSDKPHDRDAYGHSTMADDVVALLDHLQIPRALLMGYSMGSSIALSQMLSHPERLRAVVLGGIAYNDGIEDPADRRAIVDAFLAHDSKAVTHPIGRAYRSFAESLPNDLVALAALIDADRKPLDPARLHAINLPVLIVVGSNDTAIGDPKPLAEMIPGSRLLMLDGRDHMTAPSDQKYKDAVLEFFASAPR